MAIPAIFAAAARIGTSAVAGEAAGASAGAASAGRMVAQLGQAVGLLGQQAKQTTNWVGGLASKMTGELAKSLTLLIDVVGQAAAPIERLVRVANPAMADAFGRAMSDAYGVVGRLLLPVMESFIGVARKVGDVMAGFEPVFEPAINAVAKLVEVVGDEFVRALKDDAPIFELLADVFQGAVERATALVRIVGELTHVFREAATTILRLLGFGKGFDPSQTAVGAAARHAQFVQPKEIANAAIKNSLEMGIGQQKKPKDVNDVWLKLEEIRKWIERRFGQAEDFGTGVEQGFMGYAGSGNKAQSAGDPGSSFDRWSGIRQGLMYGARGAR